MNTEQHTRLIPSVFLCFLLVGTSHCAKTSDAKIEEATQALNAGNCSDSLTLAEEILADEPTHLEAVKIEASSFFCLSNLDTTDINSHLLNLTDSTDPHFSQIAGATPSDADIDNLISAAEAFDAFTGTLDDDAEFQAGMYDAYISFFIGIVDSGFNVDEASFDATAITDAHIANVADSLSRFDNLFIASGVAEDDDLVVEPRETDCLVRNAAGGAFDGDTYRDLVCCQLFENNCSNLITIATCNEVNPDDATVSAAVDTCKQGDTE